MAEVIGVRFKTVGKVYYFDPDGSNLKKGDRVIVETARGVECGEIAMENRQIGDEETRSASEKADPRRYAGRPETG